MTSSSHSDDAESQSSVQEDSPNHRETTVTTIQGPSVGGGSTLVVRKLLGEPEIEHPDEQSGGDVAEVDALQEDALADEQELPDNSDTKKVLLPYVERNEYWDKKKLCWKLVKPEKVVKSAEKETCVLFVRKVYSDSKYSHTEVDINGKFLHHVMRKLFCDASEFPLTSTKFTLKPQWFFWARHALRELADLCLKEGNEERHFEVQAALAFSAHHYPSLVVDLADPQMTTEIAYCDLWAIFPPRSLVFGVDQLEQPRVYRCIHSTYCTAQDGSQFLELSVEYAENTGHRIGFASVKLQIPDRQFKFIGDLPYRPLFLLPERQEIWRDLLDRTHKQLAFLDAPYLLKEHSGEGLIPGERRHDPPRRFHFRGRIMVDPIKFRASQQTLLIPTLSTNWEVHVGTVSQETIDGRVVHPSVLYESSNSTSEEASQVDEKITHYRRRILRRAPHLATDNSEEVKAAMTELELVLFSGLVYGFCFADSKWGAFSLSRVTDVKWSIGLLDSLVLDSGLKTSLRHIVQYRTKTTFDDFVSGKGRGFVGLLSGPPGLGKTFTAEAIAESGQRPLYVVSTGVLGATASAISKELSQILDLCAHWNAVLLLDEAEVFLAKRSLNDLERNAVVAVFLRELEYYQGIMFLTTNMPHSIDEAFSSRIHFKYHYPGLNTRARRQIWQGFTDKAAGLGTVTVGVEDAELDSFAGLDLNGRQIKNAMSIAVTLALASESHRLGAAEIMSALALQESNGPWEGPGLDRA